MTVSARSAKDLPTAAKPITIDMRKGSVVPAGTFSLDGEELVTGWHCHDLHQVEYALQGFAEVQTSTAHYLLPPQQAVWIPAGLPHQTTLRKVRSLSVFFDRALIPGPTDRARVLAAAPVVREMIIYGKRWPIHRATSDADADRYFEVLARLVVEWLDQEAPLSLPTSTHPLVAEIMAFTREHLASATAGEVCRAIGISERTLRRQFSGLAGMTWRRYLLQARLMRAMALLSEPGRTVLDVATNVGFDSVSAFTRAFRGLTGETPTTYRHRVRH